MSPLNTITDNAGRTSKARRCYGLRVFFTASLFALIAGLTSAPSLAAAQPPAQAPPRKQAEATRQFEAAQEALRQGNTDAALAAVQEGLKTASESVQGLTLLGMIYARKGDFTQAEAAFRRALQVDPRSAPAHNGMANIYLTQKKPDLAEKEFQETLRYHPHDRDANYNLGLALLARRDARQAIAYFNRVQPPTLEVRFNLVQAYFAAGEKAKATELAKLLSAQARDDVRTHFTVGVLFAGQRQYNDAIHEFETADALQPGTYEILHDLGQAYLKSGDNEKARGALERALKLSPDSVETLSLLAQADSNGNHDLDALELLVNAHKLAPRNTDVIFLLARLSMKQAFFADAIPLLEEGTKIAPQRPNLLAALGECYFMMGKVDKAKETFQTLLRVDPSARSNAFMGLCYRHLGRFDDAEKYFQQGLKLDSRDPSCLYNLGYIASRQGRYDDGEKWLKQALAVEPNYYEALLELGNLKMHQRKFAEAVPLLRKCAQLDPHPGPVYYRLATAERNLQRTEDADRDMKVFETLSRDPTPQPYPFQHLYETVDQRAGLPPEQKTQMDLDQLEQEVKAHPGQPQTLYLLAEAYLKAGREEEAKQVVSQLDQLSQGDFRTMVGIGVLLARYRLYPEAITRFETALRSNPDSDDAWYDLADAYFRKRDYANALAATQHVSAEGQKDASLLALVADIHSHLGQTQEAEKLLRQAIEQNPDQVQAYLSLALVYLRADNALAAREILQQGLARTPDAGQLLWGMGVLSVMEGKPGIAEEYLTKSVDLLPEWPGSYSALGVLYYQTGQINKARETLRRFTQGGQRGGLDVQRIEQALSSAPAGSISQSGPRELAPQRRQQFLQIALAFADQAR